MRITIAGLISLIGFLLALGGAVVANDQTVIYSPVWFVRINVASLLANIALILFCFTVHNVQVFDLEQKTRYLNKYQYGREWVGVWKPALGYFSFMPIAVYLLLSACKFCWLITIYSLSIK